MAARKEDRIGRGRLSSIDLLPEEADEDVAWALEQLRARDLPQNTILMEFNERLADKGIDAVSKSAWNRYSVRKAIQFRKLDEVQRMSSELVESLGTEGPDQVTVAVAEMLKLAMFQMLEDGEHKAKDLMELSRALQSAVGAQRGSEEYRRKLEQRVERQLEDAADRAETTAREAGLPEERIAQLRRDFLGVKG